MNSQTEEDYTFGGAHNEHYAAIGHFIYACSRVEVAAHTSLRKLLAIDEMIARTLIGQPNIGALITMFNTVAGLSGKSTEYMKELESITQECNYISSVRSMVAHNIFGWTKTKLMFSDAFVQKKLPNSKHFICTIDQLHKCAEYAELIALRIFALEMEQQHPPERLKAQIAQSSRERLGLPDSPESQMQKWHQSMRRLTQSSRE